MYISSKLYCMLLGVFLLGGARLNAQIEVSRSTQKFAAYTQHEVDSTFDALLASFPLPAIDSFFPLPPRRLTIAAVGDMMLGTSYPEGHLPPLDGATLLDDPAPYLRSADLTFGNLEGTLCDLEGEVKRCSDPSKCYAFKMPEHYAQYLVDAGFDVVSIANNHVGDFGTTGRRRTLATLRAHNLVHAGLLSIPDTVFTRNRIRYGFAAFSPNTGTADINDLEAAIATVRRLDSLSDLVIVSFHGGAEGPAARHMPRKREIFLGENRGDVYEFAHKLIDAGADLVLGHGPHVTRAIEVYKDRFITYSMGNFCTYSRFNLRGSAGVAPLLRVNLRRDGAFIDAEIVSIRQVGEGVPRIDPERRALREIIELTEADIPDHGLQIDPVTGRISVAPVLEVEAAAD